MIINKIVSSLLFIMAAIFATSLLHTQTYLLIAFIIFLVAIKHFLFPIRLELFWFLLIGFIGSGGESIIMALSGAWTYANSDLFNFPLWLPFLWGLAGIVAITLYEGLTGKR